MDRARELEGRIDEATRAGLLLVLKQAQRTQEWSLVALAVGLLTGEGVTPESDVEDEDFGTLVYLERLADQDRAFVHLLSAEHANRAYRSEALVRWLKDMAQFFNAHIEVQSVNADRTECTFRMSYAPYNFLLEYEWRREDFGGRYSGSWREASREEIESDEEANNSDSG